jgi:transcriptional regulator of arginine metabolism
MQYGRGMKKERQRIILELIKSQQVATQQELVDLLVSRNIEATQSSVSRDIVELKLTKVNGFYVPADSLQMMTLPTIELDTAGDNLIVLKTNIGQAQPTALKIDGEKIKEIVGTLAGDDTVFIAVKNAADQRAAMKAIAKLFAVSARVRRAAKNR